MSQFGKLICISGPNTGKEYLLTEDVSTIGRSEECTITIDEQLVSRNHAEIHRIDNAYQVHDLQSKNDIYVNNKRLALGSTAWLEDGGEITFASTRFRFRDPSATMTASSIIAIQERALRVDAATRQAYVDGQLLNPPLSVNQFDLLWFLYHPRNRVVSKDEIAQTVWPESKGDIYNANIDRMVSRVRSRIEPRGDEETRFISTIRGYGYKLAIPDG